MGGVSNLYLKHRTPILREMLLFLLSLMLITAGFAMMTFPPGLSPVAGSIRILMSLFGGGLNVYVIPRLASELCDIPLNRGFRMLHALFSASFIFLGIGFFLVPSGLWILTVLLIMQIVAIAGGIGFIAIKTGGLRKRWWYPALRVFLLGSCGFLLLLCGDIVITLVPINSFSFLDNLSLPLYLLFLSFGIFVFSANYLSRGSLISELRLTSDCVEYYKLSTRETELIELLLQGLSNRSIAEKLFISPKTVENHLYNIYQKFSINSRNQLLHLLLNWKNG